MGVDVPDLLEPGVSARFRNAPGGEARWASPAVYEVWSGGRVSPHSLSGR
jgi:hypothetical protein